MEHLIKVLFLVAIVLSSLILNMNLSTHARATKYLKEDVELAVHDAAIELDEDELADGKVVFDVEEAKKRFRNSLEENTGMSSDEYKILDFKVYDDSNASFPVDYEPDNLVFKDQFPSQTIVAAIETTTQKYFFSSKEETIRRIASYSYDIELPENLATMSFNTNNGISMIDGISANEYGFYWPVPYTKNLTSGFNPNRTHPITGQVRPHNGTDIASAGITNKPAVAVKDATVAFAGVASGYGNLIILNHGNGVETRYGHLNGLNVSTGDQVKGGQVVGFVGSTGDSTGAHLHFEVRIDGTPVDAMNFFK